MKTKGLEKELKPQKNQPTTVIINEKGKRIEVDFLGVLLNLDKLTENTKEKAK